MWSFLRRFGDRWKQDDEALLRAERRLDLSIADLQPFADIDRILRERRDWSGQVRAYRRMIARFGPSPADKDAKTVSVLWHALGEIYRSRIGDLRSSLEAFEKSIELDPAGESAPFRQQSIRDLRELLGGSDAV
jgi:golgin subfamily B member 1